MQKVERFYSNVSVLHVKLSCVALRPSRLIGLLSYDSTWHDTVDKLARYPVLMWWTCFTSIALYSCSTSVIPWLACHLCEHIFSWVHMPKSIALSKSHYLPTEKKQIQGVQSVFVDGSALEVNDFGRPLDCVNHPDGTWKNLVINFEVQITPGSAGFNTLFSTEADQVIYAPTIDFVRIKGGCPCMNNFGWNRLLLFIMS